ncbi:macrophage colony-stimulating factor 1b [Rhinichthys klamathensis goyatoka]|uniref:macrophage colony-stimulating factor 1b n=1 Tax=Rhinichthys klamathensis goyatoka TaxID=3034132 RepID=UPI0024B492F9|nr:macrophage colony-stimulating factor 1b [Rhinichthys klamathensis goyatoka]XP_056102636.1 macrophage colony-stimulating factor 1b [Rhinichthys klamathensis goyatoka]
MSQMNNPTPLHFYTTKGKNVCVLMLLCVPLSMMDIPGPCKHAITMDHLLQLKQLISNQLRTGCSITYSFIERKHLSVVCYVKATLPRVLELFNVHFKYVRGSGSAQAVVSIQNLILNIYSQHCIPLLNEELEEDPVAFERQYNETPVQALQRVEEVLSLYLHLITSTNTPVNWTCEQEYNINVPPTETPLTTSTEVAVGLSRQAPQGSSSDDFYRLGFIVVSICGGFLFLLTAYCLLERKKLQRQLHRTRISSDWGLQVVQNFEIQEEVYQTDRRKALGSHLSTAF